MRMVGDFEPLLGKPLRDPNPAALQVVATRWGVDPPHEFLRFLTAYGDCEISGFIVLAALRRRVHRMDLRRAGGPVTD